MAILIDEAARPANNCLEFVPVRRAIGSRMGILAFRAMHLSFAHSLLFDGRLHVGAEASLTLAGDDVPLLKKALRIASLHLPGPRLDGNLDVLVAAVPVVYRMARRYLHPELQPAADDPTLRMPGPPRSAGDHLAADLAFRFLPGLYHRCVRRDPEDDLAAALKTLLREWPLSGVLADISEPPTVGVDFGGHPGLGYQYAERWAARERPAWAPAGAVRDCALVVFHALGKPLTTTAETETGVEPS